MPMQQHAAVRAGDRARRTGDPILRGKSVTEVPRQGYHASASLQRQQKDCYYLTMN